MNEVEHLLWVKKAVRSNYKKSCESYINRYPELSVCSSNERIARRIKFSCEKYDHIGIARPPVEIAVVNYNISDYSHKIDFATHIPSFPMRLDVTSKTPVVRNRMSLLEKGVKYSMREYKRIMQCSPVQPELYGIGGALSLANHIPLTRETLMLAAAYMESNCVLWRGCRGKVQISG